MEKLFIFSGAFVACCIVLYIVLNYTPLGSYLVSKDESPPGNGMCKWSERGILEKEHLCVDSDGKILVDIWQHIDGGWSFAGSNYYDYVDADSAKKAAEKYLIEKKKNEQ